MNILVTGANGQLGNEMRVLSAENQQHTYFFTDVQELDICDEQAIRAFVTDNRVDVIVNCAAYTAVDKAEDNPELCDKLNHIAPGYLAAAAEACGAAMIQVSTDYVFDGTGHIPYTEEVTPCPNSVYGSTKLAGEQAVMEKCSRAMVIRTAWLYSIYGNNFVKTMIRLGNEREQLGVVFDQIGTPTYANDLARAIFAAVNQGIVPVFIISATREYAPGMILRWPFTAWRALPRVKSAHCIRTSIRPKLRVLSIPYWIRRRLKRLSVSRFPIGRIACRSASIGWRSKQNNTYLNIIPYIYGK